MSDKEKMEEVANRKILHECEEGIRENIHKFKRNIYDIGRLLCQAQTHFFDDRWFVAWVKDRFKDDFSYETANLYMRVYNAFEGEPEVVQVLPLTYLIGFIRQFKDESRTELMKLIEGVPIEEIREKFREEWVKMHPEKTGAKVDHLQKYKEDRIIKHYELVVKGCSGFVKWNNQIKNSFTGIPGMMEELCNPPFMPENSLDVLRKMIEDEDIIKIIHRHREVLDRAEEAINKAMEVLQRKVGEHIPDDDDLALEANM